MAELLCIDQLTIAYSIPPGIEAAVRQVSLEISAGRILGLVGESGSGKSTLAMGIMRYLPDNGSIVQGSIRYKGRDIYELEHAEMRRIWGNELVLVPQDPISALNPSIHVGEQIAEVLRLHGALTRSEARSRTLAWLEKVRFPEPQQVFRSYPHQLSGGMQQRVMIAMALCTEPDLLILDEPTTNLDATTQAAIIDLICELMAEHETAALYISHNLGVVAQICDDLAVLYAGELVEHGPTNKLYRHPLHPYTRGLLDSVPRLGVNKRSGKIQAIQGSLPSAVHRPSGCVFRDRCPLATEICEQEPALHAVADGHLVRCHRWESIERGEIDARQPTQLGSGWQSSEMAEDPRLEVLDLKVRFDKASPFLAPAQERRQSTNKAVDGVSFSIRSGETLGLVGESGSGKTTTARAILGLVRPAAGEVHVAGTRLAADLRQRPLKVRRMLQMVFQDPAEAFNPYQSLGQALSRPLIRLAGNSPAQARGGARRMLNAVQLPAEYSDRYPDSLSGGERQRVAIARALASSPDLLIADEAVSALDVSVQAAILNLLADLQGENRSATLFISHDIAAVGYIADRIAVMYLGQLMQVADAQDLFEPPYHPYTEALLSSIPLLDPEAHQERIRLTGDPTPVEGGCPFYHRCPRRFGEVCRDETPPWQTTEQGTRIYCHIPLAQLEQAQVRVFKFSDGGKRSE